jgi:hypothetical protein
MTTTPYELLARFATDGTIAGVSVRYLTTVNGKVYEGDPQPLASVDDPAFNDFADQFAAAVVAERDDLAEQVESLTQVKEAAEASVDQLTVQVAALTSEKATLTQQLAAANARIASLLTEVPYDPRVIEASAFINRTTPEEMLQLFGSQDANVQAIAQMLLAYKANDWRIELDSTEMQQAVGYLQLSGLVTAERAAALLRDGTRAESYVDDGSN